MWCIECYKKLIASLLTFEVLATLGRIAKLGIWKAKHWLVEAFLLQKRCDSSKIDFVFCLAHLPMTTTSSHARPSETSVPAGTEGLASDSEILARLSVSLPRSLYRQLRLHALEQDTTLSALLARLIRKELG